MKRIGLGTLASFALLVVGKTPAQAQIPKWDLVSPNPYVGNYYVQDGTYGVNMYITYEDLTTGDLTGYFSGTGTTVTGYTVGDAAYIHATPILAYQYIDFSLDINPAGSLTELSGSLVTGDNGHGSWTGFEDFVGGPVTLVATPEPGSIALCAALGLSGSLLAVRRRLRQRTA